MKSHGDRTRAVLIPVLLLLAAPGVTLAASRLALNLVWTRVADVNGEEGSVESAEFSPDGRLIVTGSKFDDQVIMWRTSDGAELWRATEPLEIERVGWSTDGRLVASANEDFTVRLYRASDGTLVKELPHTQGIDALVFAHDGHWLATGEERLEDGKGRLRLFRMPEAELEITRLHGGTINSLSFNSDDSLLISAGDGEANLWRTADMSLVWSFAGEPGQGLVTVRFSPDDELIALSGFGGTIRLLRAEDGEVVRQFNHTGRKIEVVEWSPDGQYLVSAGHDPSIFVYRLADILQEERIPVAYKSLATDNMEFLDFNSQGSMLTSAHQDGMVRLWVWMSEDPEVNRRRHRQVTLEQREWAEERANEEPP